MADKEAKKTMDVSKPGKSAPDTSARPVIITHRPMVQDPMVKTDSGEEVTTEEPASEAKPAIHNKVIQPVAADEATAEAVQPEAATEPETTPEDSPAPEKKAVSAATFESDEEAVVGAVADQATSDKKNQNKLSDEDKARQTALQKLIAEKKYFVPIGQVSQRRHRRATMAILVLLLIVVGGYLAVDASLIPTNIKLPVDIIKN